MDITGKDLLDAISARAQSISARVKSLRREIHRNPELSGKEKRTAALVAGVLTDLGIETTENVGGHGVVGVLRCTGARGRQSPTIALRADMDALPLQEQSSADYASCVPGVMHGCGHDVHTAVLLGTAMTLGGLKDRLKGNVKFIFQPSEEDDTSGAELMVADGALKNPAPQAIVALHCFPEMEVGTIGHRPGVMTASADTFTIVVEGKSGHASRPHQTVDAVLLGAMVVSAIHHIVSRKTDPLHRAVISIGKISGGTAPNIIAGRVELQGTVRTIDEGERKNILAIIEETVKGVTRGMGGDYEIEYGPGTPCVVNDRGINGLVAAAAADILGEGNVIEMADPLLGAEDFAFFTEKVPAALFRLGTGNRTKGIVSHLHSATFDIDEDALTTGTLLMSWIAARFLNKF